MESDQQIEFDDEDTRRDDSKRGMRIKVQIEQHPPLDIPVGRGKQTIKWLSFVAVQRAKSIQPTGCLRVRDENLMKAQVHSVWKATVNTNMRLNTDQMMGDGSLRPDLAIKDVLQDGELVRGEAKSLSLSQGFAEYVQRTTIWNFNCRFMSPYKSTLTQTKQDSFQVLRGRKVPARWNPFGFLKDQKKNQLTVL